MKSVAWKLIPGPFLIFKESYVKKNLRRSVCGFAIGVVLHFLQMQKGLELTFTLQFFCNMAETGQISLTDCAFPKLLLIILL